jgi:hypothetical protein
MVWLLAVFAVAETAVGDATSHVSVSLVLSLVLMLVFANMTVAARL